jgi:two-component system nitrogen regulation response regulator NtrX
VEDIPPLVWRFVVDISKALGKRIDTIPQQTMQALLQYPWPGNVRELRNVVERLMIMVPGDRISSRDLAFLDQGIAPAAGPAKTAPLAPLHDARDQFERDYILRALAQQHGNISRTAEVLGVERSNLYRKMRGFGIAPARKSDEDESV